RTSKLMPAVNVRPLHRVPNRRVRQKKNTRELTCHPRSGSIMVSDGICLVTSHVSRMATIQGIMSMVRSIPGRYAHFANRSAVRETEIGRASCRERVED